ncbi:MAG TPA: hypothetical protein VGI45_32070 [Terracidiphilus sp.]|jgi:hypothetical protein
MTARYLHLSQHHTRQVLKAIEGLNLPSLDAAIFRPRDFSAAHAVPQRTIGRTLRKVNCNGGQLSP